MKKCKWAFDEADEYCKNCNGITMMTEGKETSCDNCAGYEEGEEDISTDIKNEDVEINMPKPVEEKLVENKNTKENNAKTAKEDKLQTNKQKNKQDTKTEAKSIQNYVENNIVSEVTLLSYMSGATICHNDTYYKFECREERKLPEGLSNEQVQEQREMLWAHLNSEVDKQIEDVIRN